MAEPGHNGANKQLQSFIERIERLMAEKKDLQSDITEIFAEAKGSGFDARIMRLLIKERAMDLAARQEQEALLETYRAALGDLAEMPLGKAALTALSA